MRYSIDLQRQILSSVIVASLATVSNAQYLGLPLAESRVGRDLAPTWAPLDGTVHADASFGDALLNLADAVIASGPPASGVTNVAVWKLPALNDPIAAYGWHKAQDIVPIDAPRGAGLPLGFGSSIAGDANWLFVGAPQTGLNGNARVGAVHVYRREGTGPWVPVTVLVNPIPEHHADYGAALDFDGATLVVGVPGRIAPGTDEMSGGADSYQINGLTIGPAISFTGPPHSYLDFRFGCQVAVEGNTIALASALLPTEGVGITGGVLIATIAGPREPVVVETTLLPPDLQLATEFGLDIDLDASTGTLQLAIGAPLANLGGLQDNGAVRVYERVRGVWTVVATIAGTSHGARLGQVALDHDLISVGSIVSAGFDGEVSLYRMESQRGGSLPNCWLAPCPPTLGS